MKFIVRGVILLLMAALVGIGLVIALVGVPRPRPTTVADAAQPADARILFVGNSLTFFNDLDQLVARLAEDVVPGWDTVLGMRVAPGGYTLSQHYDDASGIAGDTLLRQLLVSGPEAARQWDWVILQGQSQIPGLDEGHPQHIAFRRAVVDFQPLITATGANTMLLQTWGHRLGDGQFFPDYPTMQTQLVIGYEAAARQATTPQRPVYVAPAGVAWLTIYNDEPNPLAADSRFSQLYADNNHPALPGSYLTASVLVATLSGERVTDARYVPRGLNREEAARLRALADRIVFETLNGARRYVP